MKNYTFQHVEEGRWPHDIIVKFDDWIGEIRCIRCDALLQTPTDCAFHWTEVHSQARKPPIEEIKAF